MTDETKTTPGVTYFYQGEGQTHPLFRIAEGIPCRRAREEASEMMGVSRDEPSGKAWQRGLLHH